MCGTYDAILSLTLSPYLPHTYPLPYLDCPGSY